MILAGLVTGALWLFALASAAAAHPDPAAEFRAIADAVENSRNVYWGRQTLRDYEAQLAAGSLDGPAEFQLRLKIGWERLKLGDNDGAIAELERCLATAKATGSGSEAVKSVLRLLALAHMRAGETQNCVSMHNAESCVFPLRGGGVHGDKAHAERAMDLYASYLALDPGAGGLFARWLLNIAAMQAGRYPGGVPPALLIPPERFASKQDIGRFPDVAPKLGLATVDLAGGGIMEDFDGDGFLDLMTSSSDPEGPIVFFRSNGDGTFSDRSHAAGLDVERGGLYAVQTDYNNDGWPDLFVPRGGWQGADGRWRKSLLRNNGPGHAPGYEGEITFTDVTYEAGLAEPAYPTQTAAWGDYDNDGDLDLFIGNETTAYTRDGQPYPSQLFRNDGPSSIPGHEGEVTFTDVAARAGVVNMRPVKGAAWGDYDNDGRLDLYVSNIGPNRLYHNRGDGTFEDVAVALGVTEPSDRSFATWFWDYDNDGWLDIYVGGYRADASAIAAFYAGLPVPPGVERIRLYHNLGGHGFEDVASKAGLDGVYLPMGCNFGDLDNDGWPDFYLGTGDPNYETLTPNVMFRNDAGRRFVDVTTSGGFGNLQKGHGVAFGDLDNDGDQDIFEQMGGFFPGDKSPDTLYENPGHPSNHWLTVKLTGTKSNRPGIGARIRVVVREAGAGGSAGATRAIYAVGGTGSSFGANSLQQEIGLGPATKIELLEVSWPASGTTQRFTKVPLDRVIEVREADERLRVLERKRIRLGGGSD